MDYIAPSCHWKGGPPLDPEQWKRAITSWRTASPIYAYRVRQLVAEDDMVTAIPTFTSTHRGVFQSRRAGFGPWEPTGK